MWGRVNAVGHALTREGTFDCSVPRLILGPLFFLLYTNNDRQGLTKSSA